MHLHRRTEEKRFRFRSLLTITKNTQSDLKQDIVINVIYTLCRCKKAGITATFIWIPVHKGIEEIDMTVSYREARIKSKIRNEEEMARGVG